MTALEALTDHFVAGPRHSNRRRNSIQRRTVIGTVALALILPACDEMPTAAPEMDLPHVPGSPALSAIAADGSASRVIETTYIATLVGFIPVSETVRPNDGNTRRVTTLVWESTGDWEGIWVGDVRSTSHRNGVTTDQATFSFEGTVLGSEGTLDLRFDATFGPDGTFNGKATILSGTGELANLHGHVTVEIVGPGVIKGTARVQFAP